MMAGFMLLKPTIYCNKEISQIESISTSMSPTGLIPVCKEAQHLPEVVHGTFFSDILLFAHLTTASLFLTLLLNLLKIQRKMP
jgi:hypothetical protein